MRVDADGRLMRAELSNAAEGVCSQRANLRAWIEVRDSVDASLDLVERVTVDSALSILSEEDS